MGGTVSSGRDNDELVDNLMGSNYIRTRSVELVFRAVDRAEYMLPEAREQAYKDLAWRSGPLHMSAPCIYSEVMEGLQLRSGLSFLNVGSGTGYLSTMVGLVIGAGGVNHGVELHPTVLQYANTKLKEFIDHSNAIDEFDFCEPKFFQGNGLCLGQTQYDRVYCGAGCPGVHFNYFKRLLKVGGLLLMPLNDNLVQVKRVADNEWHKQLLLNVSFATLRPPTETEIHDHLTLDSVSPPCLQSLARGRVRSAVRTALTARHPELTPPPARPRKPPTKPKQLCIPLDRDSDNELNALHDLDPESGSHEMNALLNLMLSMGHNHVAGTIRFDHHDYMDSSDNEDNDNEEITSDEDDDPPPPENPEPAQPEEHNHTGPPTVNANLAELPTRGRLSVTLEFNDPTEQNQEASQNVTDSTPPPTERTRSRKRHSVSSVDDERRESASERSSPSSSSSIVLSKEEKDKSESSTEESSTPNKDGAKRQKFDSGIGEENSPSSSANECKTDESDGADGSALSDSSEDEGVDASQADHRRVFLSQLMRSHINELPLPPALKRYLCYGRQLDD